MSSLTHYGPCGQGRAIWHEAEPYLQRNHTIVAYTDVLIATPAQVHEIKRGSGTWHTIRLARRLHDREPYIINPDGSIQTREEK